MKTGPRSGLPAVHRILDLPAIEALAAAHGRTAVVDAVRRALDQARQRIDGESAVPATDLIVSAVARHLSDTLRPSPRPVYNLTGTILHTNLGRATLPEEAIAAMIAVARAPADLEYDLAEGARGERDHHVLDDLRHLTGAEAACIVNNNAAAVMLTLNTLARGKDVPVSRGELIEIGGSFRIPDIMARAGAKLREVGTTNRTHLRDFAEAIGPRAGLVMKVHTSNYTIEGFTAAADERALAALCRERGVPFAIDLGSGTLVDLARYGLPHEPTPAEAIAAGADLVTFSGDKLLGGPQAGIIVGRAALIARLNRNPMKRALRVDKLTLAALSAVLKLYRDPDRLAERLPTLCLLARSRVDIDPVAATIAGPLRDRLGDRARIRLVDCASQIGSGALPSRTLPSRGLALEPTAARREAGRALARLASDLRALAIPVIGRIESGALILDCRTLFEAEGFVANLAGLATLP
ncbi:MAG: L-seryl-tRNA(Sec) selenium transferase [Alphaproteobacteria bacterium]|nr:L-seryl-tRNA(Sec) selenium transferase [Alphaproteobacteria bacterium]